MQFGPRALRLASGRPDLPDAARPGELSMRLQEGGRSQTREVPPAPSLELAILDYASRRRRTRRRHPIPVASASQQVLDACRMVSGRRGISC
jgi:hypothetical protein